MRILMVTRNWASVATWRRRVAESNPFQILMPHEAEQ